jgi:hypothetical protein
VRRFTLIAVLAALVLSFGKAPFEHTHDSDPDHQHATGISHTHWGEAVSDTGTDESWTAGENSDARMVDWIPGDGRAPVHFAVVLPESVAAPIPAMLIVRVPETASRGHDPPVLLALCPRAPPA